ncbi:C-C motif chemokine 25 [Tupaia chinensis]|uniref:C-C motif chemokine 25 n=1 Tax=Tupaia chinensis TaxID=246437 RepID=UPI000FFB60D5|nr:C-C motif chemokine 25 [Tupaia chinensis]
MCAGIQGGGPACAMNLWLLACLVGCLLAAWSPDVRAQGVFGDCCLSYDKQGLQQKLRFAQNYKLQEVSGSCNLRAVMFFFPQRRKPLCGDPRNRLVRKAMKCMDAQRKSLHKCLRDHSGKGRPGISGQFLSNSNHLISGKKKAHFPIVNPGL